MEGVCYRRSTVPGMPAQPLSYIVFSVSVSIAGTIHISLSTHYAGKHTEMIIKMDDCEIDKIRSLKLLAQPNCCDSVNEPPCFSFPSTM